MGSEEVIAKLCKDKAIRAAFVLEGDAYDEAIAEEKSITESTFGMPLVNRALEAVMKKRTAVCIFCESSFEVPTDHMMIMEDVCGNRIGHDVPKCMVKDFIDNPDIFWLCDDFVLYPDKTDARDVVMVMLPQEMKSIGENEGVRGAVLLYPATTTDIILRMHFGMPLGDPKIASAILAFDLL
jgi:hypothetical protein